MESAHHPAPEAVSRLRQALAGRAALQPLGPGQELSEQPELRSAVPYPRACDAAFQVPSAARSTLKETVPLAMARVGRVSVSAAVLLVVHPWGFARQMPEKQPVLESGYGDAPAVLALAVPAPGVLVLAVPALAVLALGVLVLAVPAPAVLAFAELAAALAVLASAAALTAFAFAGWTFAGQASAALASAGG